MLRDLEDNCCFQVTLLPRISHSQKRWEFAAMPEIPSPRRSPECHAVRRAALFGVAFGLVLLVVVVGIALLLAALTLVR